SKKSKKLKARQINQSGRVINYADRAVNRLHERYERMIHAGKPRNVAIIAVARELACFIWGYGKRQDCVINCLFVIH
ncbi:hypothetical protein HMPREF9102_2005, partial [Limosilactobacillus oris F0423]